MLNKNILCFPIPYKKDIFARKSKSNMQMKVNQTSIQFSFKLILTVLMAIRFGFVEDFTYLFKRRREPLPDGRGSIIDRHNF